MNYFSALLMLLLVSCDSPVGSSLASDREKQTVSGDIYLSEDICWGGIGVKQEGVWIPVELAVDKTENFTKIGIISRTCKIETVDEFVKEAGGDVPPHFVSEWQADFFPFVMPDVSDDDDLLGSSRLLTPTSTTDFQYSEKVVFFDGYMMLGPPIKAPVGGGEFFNVVKVAISPG